MSRFFSLFLIAFLAFLPASFGADANNYLVENVAVNVTGKTPNAARNTAIATARRDAFLILLTRLEIKIDVADKVSDDEISDMVRSEQIDGEKIAGNNYSATFNIMFAQDFVDHILLQKKSTTEDAKDISNETHLLIPVKLLKRRTILWEENNDWRKAVEKDLKERSGVRFIVPDADVNNIAILNRDNVALVDYNGLEPMLNRYRSDAAYTMFFVYDEAANKVNVDVFYIRKLQKKQIKLSFINVDNLSYEELISKVAQKTISYLSDSQNLQKQSVSSNMIRLGVYVGSLGNWLMVKNKIEKSNLVNQLNIESLSRDYAVISINYIDARTNIVDAFSSIGISLDQKGDNFYTLKAY